MKSVGNILGSGRAESDQLILERAFVPTPDFQALIGTTDFNFVVGRRGTGKSTLFQKVSEHLETNDRVLLWAERTDEALAMALHERVRGLVTGAATDHRDLYRTARAICRVAWKVQMLTVALEALRAQHGRRRLASDLEDLASYTARHSEIFASTGVARCDDIIRYTVDGVVEPLPTSLPRLIAERYELDTLTTTVRRALVGMSMRAVLMFDGLDEGWTPEALSTAVIGGLAIAAADLADKQTEVHAVLFVRDNIFRALAQFDIDASRHIDGSTLRLHWNADGLLALVAARLRVALELPEDTPVSTWNRFATRELKGLEGFRLCLRQTLYRPRDALVLLNEAYVVARRAERSMIIGEDLDGAAKRISQSRLDDLLKEYDRVLPGLKVFVEAFRRGPARSTVGEVVSRLDRSVSTDDITEPAVAVDFALLGSGTQIFSALQSIGFIGVYDPSVGRYSFCHDGANADVDFAASDARVAIHPCYWRALEVEVDSDTDGSLIDIHDEYEPDGDQEVTELRNKRFGQILGQLPHIPKGVSGQRDFEQWVSTTIQIIFAGQFKNVQFLPTDSPTEPRNIVAVSRLSNRFWRRIATERGTTRILIGVVNYDEPHASDVAQIASHPAETYGRYHILVTRSRNEGLTPATREFIVEQWSVDRRAILVVGAGQLSRCLTKQRKTMRPEYTEDTFARLTDTLMRSYLKQHLARYKRKR